MGARPRHKLRHTRVYRSINQLCRCEIAAKKPLALRLNTIRDMFMTAPRAFYTRLCTRLSRWINSKLKRERVKDRETREERVRVSEREGETEGSARKRERERFSTKIISPVKNKDTRDVARCEMRRTSRGIKYLVARRRNRGHVLHRQPRESE